MTHAHGAVARARARLATLSRWGASTTELLDARQELEASKAEQTLTRLVAEYPALTDDQRGRLSALLTP